MNTEKIMKKHRIAAGMISDFVNSRVIVDQTYGAFCVAYNAQLTKYRMTLGVANDDIRTLRYENEELRLHAGLKQIELERAHDKIQSLEKLIQCGTKQRVEIHNLIPVGAWKNDRSTR